MIRFELRVESDPSLVCVSIVSEIGVHHCAWFAITDDMEEARMACLDDYMQHLALRRLTR